MILVELASFACWQIVVVVVVGVSSYTTRPLAVAAVGLVQVVEVLAKVAL